MNGLLLCKLSVCVSFVLSVASFATGAEIGIERGIIVLLNLPDGGVDEVAKMAESSELILYVQTDDAKQADNLRKKAEAVGLLGSRIVVDHDSLATIHIASNVADVVLVCPSAKGKTPDQELMRVLRPRGRAIVGDREHVKPVPDGIDDWTHAYHGPDNNPQSQDKLVKGDFRTQFIGFPKFSPMPEQSVVGGGRIYKAMGHIAHKANQNEMLNTLLCINAYNGTILWRRELPQGFMIHRNTMIATDDALLMGDDQSCKVINGSTGAIDEEITVPAEITDGPVWKWMARHGNVLFGLVGHEEVKVDTQKSTRRGLGHWPWGMWKGHNYADPKTAFGFGRTFVAIDLKSKNVLWHYRDGQFLDARAVAMKDGRIYAYCPQKFLACLDANDGRLLWKNSDKELLDAIAPNGPAQHYVTGYATTCYMKCSDDYLLFAGPQRGKLVAASTKDGKLAWTFPVGNLQLVLRDDAIWAAGPQRTKGVRLDYKTGEVLAEFPARRACTRATGCADSIFYRASGGTVRVRTESNTAQHIAPMRPPCQDGVIVSNGMLYWGPWMCGCQLSLYGNIGLAPAPSNSPADYDFTDSLVQSERYDSVKPLGQRPGDWTTYRANNSRNDVAATEIPKSVSLIWKTDVTSGYLPTAPVAAGALVFVADRSGTVQAFNESGKRVWKAFTCGPIYYPPAIAHDRLFVGSADGRVYAFEAATGRFLWSFRVGPRVDRIPVFGNLVSRWPVAGGVAVDGDTVYAAAGITHYDGTYVVALDTVTGNVKARNITSGVLSEQVNDGISLQGNLSITDDELRFLAGGVYEVARYDLKTLKCLNSPSVQVSSQFRTAFYPYYPAYGKYVSLDYGCSDGCTLSHDASYEGSVFTSLALQEPLPAGVDQPRKEAARWIRRRGAVVPKAVWQDKANRRFTSFVIGQDRLLTTGHPDAKPDEAFLAAISIKDGSDVWWHKLPADAVKGGVAVDGAGRIYVSLENGQLLCFVPKNS